MVLSVVTQERNYQRRSHRVDLPLWVEIGDQSYRAKDWSMTGVGLLDYSRELKAGEVLNARCVLPMKDSTLTIKVKLSFKSNYGNVAGFEFVDINAKTKRVLRHYIELAIEGKLDNLEDLVSIVTTPAVDSPIEEALTLSDIESDSIAQKFKNRSYLAIAVGVIFFALVGVTIFYNTLYRIQGTGIVSGNVERVTANYPGRVAALFAKQNTFVAADTPLFRVEDESSRERLANVEMKIQALEDEITELEQARESGQTVLVQQLASSLKTSAEEYQSARRLFDRRVLSIKDFKYVEAQYLRSKINYTRELDRQQQESRRHTAAMKRLSDRLVQLVTDRADLADRAGGQTIKSPATGKIYHVEHRPGEYVLPQHAVILLEKDTKPHVLVKISAYDAVKVHVGMEARIHVPMENREYTATVTAIGYSAVNSEFSVSQEASLNETLVKLDFSDPTVRLPANSRVNVWIKTLKLFG